MYIYIIRHGETDRNHAKVLQGRSDLPLNGTGIAQAEKAGAWFRAHGVFFDRVYTSPLRRAAETARLAAGTDTPLHTDPRLLEMDYGPYEGMNLSSPAPELAAFFRDFAHHPAPAGMEPLSAVSARLGAFLKEIKQGPHFQNILVSTHAVAMKGALEFLTPESNGSYWSRYIGNCAVYKTELKNGIYSVPIAVYTP